MKRDSIMLFGLSLLIAVALLVFGVRRDTEINRLANLYRPINGSDI